MRLRGHMCNCWMAGKGAEREGREKHLGEACRKEYTGGWLFPWEPSRTSSLLRTAATGPCSAVLNFFTNTHSLLHSSGICNMRRYGSSARRTQHRREHPPGVETESALPQSLRHVPSLACPPHWS